jgi:predicted amidophosphoribosyltransferase
MSLTSCPECRTQVSTEATACPKCGHPFKKTAERMSGCSMFFLIVGAIIAACLLLKAC